MKRLLIISSIIFVLIVFYSIASMFRLSPLEKQKQQEAIWFENKYQEGIKQISEGRFADAMTSLCSAALSNYRHARVLYYYAEAEETGEPFYIDDEVPEGYSGPLAQRILALKDKMERIKAEKAKTEKVREGKAEVEAAVAGESKDGPYKAIELVKNDPTLLDSGTGKILSVEKRMMDVRESDSANVTWRYETLPTEKSKYRVTRYVDNGRGESFIRSWIVNVSTNEVSPENPTAKKLYN